MSEYRNLNLDEIDLMTPYAREFAKTGLVPRKMPVTREQVLEKRARGQCRAVHIACGIDAAHAPQG